MPSFDEIVEISPFSLASAQKAAVLCEQMQELTTHHYGECDAYRKILDTLRFDPGIRHTLLELPFLPVRIFKDHDLLSVPRSDILKVMSSSGTTGQRVSRIFLDRATAERQVRVLAKVVGDFLGKQRLPTLILDSEAIVKDRRSLSARGAAILGFSVFGRDLTYAFDETMHLELSRIEEFCERHRDKTVLLFGFTSVIWTHFYKPLLEARRKLSLDNAILIHGGGWKTLQAEAVDNDEFKARLGSVCGVRRVHNYYGMVEQTGSIFFECDSGNLHCSIFSDIIIRGEDFRERSRGEPGLIQLLSLLPSSYPGHNILSEDIGQITGEDDCACGRLGKHFKVLGRAPQAEVRGCGVMIHEV